jgi:hypothetical protein
MKEQKIKSNKAKCNVCGDLIESTSRWDFVKCQCGNLHVDGGKDYIKRGYAHGANSYTELSEYEKTK